MAESGWSVGTVLKLKPRESSSLFVVFVNAPDSGFLLTSQSAQAQSVLARHMHMLSEYMVRRGDI